jgi:hypothetical protein
MAFLRGEEGAALCIALLCTIVLRRRLSWPIRRQNPYQHQFVNVNNNNYSVVQRWREKRKLQNAGKR